jgi:hypothetical protein
MPDITQLPILHTATNQTYLISVDNGIAKRLPLTGVNPTITGPIGYAGSIGATGYTGSVSTIPGYIGSKGYTGSQGIQGIPGEAAQIGYTGSTGYIGSIGPSTLLNVLDTTTSSYRYVVGMTRAGTDTQAVISSSNPFIFVPNTGRVGIGSTDPLGTLHLKSAQTPELYFEQANTSTMHKIYAKGGSLYIDIDTTNFAGGSNFYISQAGKNKLILNSQGYLGVNNSIPRATLDVAGNIIFANTGTSIELVQGYGTFYQADNFEIISENQRYVGTGTNGLLHAGSRIVGSYNTVTNSSAALDFYLTTVIDTIENQTNNWEKVLELRTDQIEAYQNVRIDGDLEVDGGDIVTLNTSFNLLNTTATTINAFGVANNLNIGTTLPLQVGTVTFGQDTLVGTNASQNIFNSNATTVNAFGAATTLNMGNANGIATLRNQTLVGVNATQNLYNTVATTVNFAGQATTLNIAVDAATPTTVTIGNNAGTVYIPGSLEVKGAFTYLETTNTVIKDALIDLHTTFDGSGNIASTTTNDTADIGLRLHYNDSTEKAAALIMNHQTRDLEWYITGAETLPNSFVGNYGTFKTANIHLVGGSNATSTNTGALQVIGGAGIAGDIYTTGEIIIANNNNNNHGGGTYAAMLTLTNNNLSIPNNNKFVRIDNVGTLQIINSAYSSTILSLTDTGTLTTNNIVDSSLTSGRVTYASTDGKLVDSDNLKFDGTTLFANSLTVATTVTAVIVHATSNSTGTNFQVGDDAWIGDIDQLNTLCISGQQNTANGYIVFGNTPSDRTALGRIGTGPLTYGNDPVVLASSTTTNARTAITVTQSTLANTSTLTYTTGTGVINFTPAFGLGLQGETWHDVLSTPGRSVNTPYTNPNLYPIMVNVSLIGSNTTATSAAVNGVRVAYTANTLSTGTWTSSASFIVPPKTTYICSGTAIMSWAELY